LLRRFFGLAGWLAWLPFNNNYYNNNDDRTPGVQYQVHAQPQPVQVVAQPVVVTATAVKY
jgi:hypothetical protein